MHHHALWVKVIAWAVDNALAIVAGGYAGYKWGHVVEAAAAKVLGWIKRA
jgi:hypothetical protein